MRARLTILILIVICVLAAWPCLVTGKRYSPGKGILLQTNRLVVIEAPRPHIQLARIAETPAGQSPGAAAPRVGQPGKDILWLTTPEPLVERMLDLAIVTSRDVVMDLGSGDGRLVLAAAARGARGIGIEYDPALVVAARAAAVARNLDARATFVQGDLFMTDLSPATVVTLFLRTELNLRLRPTLLGLRSGTRIVSNTFDMGDWEPDDVAVIERGCAPWCTALLWIVPADVSGTWRTPEGELKLAQAFQVISGILGSDHTQTRVTDGRLRGSTLKFEANGATYTAVLAAGHTLEGSKSMNGHSERWTANRISGSADR